MRAFKRVIAGAVVCVLCALGSALSLAGESAHPIQIELIITDHPPRYLAKDEPDDNRIDVERAEVGDRERYGAQVKFFGCTPDEAGNCQAKVLFVLLDPRGRQRFTSGWLRLWYDRPAPPIGEPRIGQEGMGGEIRGDPPGEWELVAVVRDEVSGLLSATTASFSVQPPLMPVTAVGASHCGANESVVFFCRSGTKVISVCASPNVLQRPGHLAYRFGRPGGPPEMDFPPKGTSPAAVFSYFASSYAKGGTELLQFSVGEFTYQVFSEHHAFNWSGSGVVVNRGPTRTAYFACQEDSIVNNLYELRHLGLPGSESTKFLDHEPPK
jgi:hypothetical protein